MEKVALKQRLAPVIIQAYGYAAALTGTFYLLLI